MRIHVPAFAKTKAQISSAVTAQLITVQLNSNHTADQRHCFCYVDSTIPILPKLEINFCGCTARFVSDLVGNPEDRFSCDTAHIV